MLYWCGILKQKPGKLDSRVHERDELMMYVHICTILDFLQRNHYNVAEQASRTDADADPYWHECCTGMAMHWPLMYTGHPQTLLSS